MKSRMLKLSDLIAPDPIREQHLALARTWCMMFEASSDPKYLTRAKQLIKIVKSKSNPTQDKSLHLKLVA